MRRVLISFVIIAVFEIPVALSQDFRNRFAKMYEQYNGASAMHLRISVEVYQNKNSSVPFFHETGDINKADVNYHYRFGAIEMLMNENFIIMLDHGAFEIVCTKRSLEAEAKFRKDAPIFEIEKALISEPELVEQKDGLVQYRASTDEGEILQTDLIIRELSNELVELRYHYKDGHLAVIKFSELNRSPVFDKDEFNELVFFTVSGDRFIKTAKYWNYNLTVSK